MRVMGMKRLLSSLVVLLSATSLWSGQVATPVPSVAFVERTGTDLIGQPAEPKHSMGAAAADLDGDGDLDVAIAAEYAPNRVLINDGSGRLTDESDTRLPRTVGDHEDVAIADFDRDGDLDLVFVGEDDQVSGYHLNDGRGVFADVTERLPTRGTSNAVLAEDVDRDGDADLVIGNDGQDLLFVNDGAGMFADETAGRLPVSEDVTQDVAVGDVDGDGDRDLILGNEDGNKALMNDGSGRFTDETESRLPPAEGGEETRNVDLGDVDGDGDLDLYYANVLLFVPDADPQDRLLINDGSGRFTDETVSRLPAEGERTMTASFLDVDRDGDVDLITGIFGDPDGVDAPSPFHVFRNDGSGVFRPYDEALSVGVSGNGFDIEPADFDGDGLTDVFLANRGGTDRLLMALP